MRQTRRFVVMMLAALSVSTAACGSKRVETSGGDAASEATPVIVVDNRGFADMTIYLLEGGSVRHRLGTANGLSRTRLTISRSFVGNGRDLQFVADPIGSNRASVSQRIFVRPGDSVVMTIMP